jgi:hypothetical protein
MDTAGKLEASDLFISSTYNIAFGAYTSLSVLAASLLVPVFFREYQH